MDVFVAVFAVLTLVQMVNVIIHDAKPTNKKQTKATYSKRVTFHIWK